MYSFFQSQGVGDALIRYATEEFGADNLWEENTTEYLVKLEREVLDRSRRRNAFSFLNEKINSI